MKIHLLPILAAVALMGFDALGAASAPAAASSSNPPRPAGGREYSSFQLISERNIFNSARASRSARTRSPDRRSPKVQTVTFVGVILYEKGPFAFFDGSSGDYRKVVGPGKEIAGYKVTAVDGNSVTLEAGTNRVTLHVGMQLRREEDGEWQVVGGSSAPTTAASESSTASAADEESDIVKRMMQQREQELK